MCPVLFELFDQASNVQIYMCVCVRACVCQRDRDRTCAMRAIFIQSDGGVLKIRDRYDFQRFEMVLLTSNGLLNFFLFPNQLFI